MRRLALLLSVALLAGACASTPTLNAPGPLAAGTITKGTLGWARLADIQEALHGQEPDLLIRAYLACADNGEAAGDKGAAVLCLEAAYRLSFKQSGVQRWDQEAQRAKIARRLQGIKTRQGRQGAAASYAAMAALSEAYLDGGQADDDKKAYAEAQARIAEAQKQKEAADNQAMAGFFSSVMGSALNQGMGAISSGQASLNILQGEIDYLEKDSANSEAAKGLDEAQAALRQGTVMQASDRASLLLAANLASAVDTAPYAKGVQAALRASPLSKRKGPIADFLALAPPERSRSSKRDFVQAFQAAEKALWKADLDAEPLDLARLKPEDLGGAWDRPVDATPIVPFVDVFSEGAYERVIGFDGTSGGKSLQVPVKMTAQVDSSKGAQFGMELRPLQGSGFHFINTGAFSLSTLSFAKALSATGSAIAVTDHLGFGIYLPLGEGDAAALALDLGTRLFEVGNSEVLWGSQGYEHFDFAFLGVDLEASARLFQFIKLGLRLPLLAPIGTDDSRDAGGLVLQAGLCFAFSPSPSAARLKAAREAAGPGTP